MDRDYATSRPCGGDGGGGSFVFDLALEGISQLIAGVHRDHGRVVIFAPDVPGPGPAPIPLPATLPLLGVALAALGLARRWRT